MVREMRARPSSTTHSKPIIKAPSPVLRCETARTILHSRALAVKAAKTIDEFYVVEGKGWMKYCRHVRKCAQCKAYEDQHRAEQEKRFTASEIKAS